MYAPNKFIVVTLILSSALTILNSQTNIYLVRHAEKVDNSAESDLTSDGLERAQNLSEILARYNVSSVHSTNYKRTLNTAKPTADIIGKNVIIYDENNFNYLKELIEKFSNENILVVGHSNTIPKMLNVLKSTDQYNDIPEEDFSRLYMIKAENGTVEVTLSDY